MSNPQEPYQPRHADAGMQPPAPPRQPPAPLGPPQVGAPEQSGTQEYGTRPYGTPEYGTPQDPRGMQPGGYGTPGGYPDASPFGLPGRPPARDRKKLYIVLGIAAGVVLVAIIGIVLLFNIFGSATNQARGLADGFTKLVIAGDSAKAYDDYLDPALQEQLLKEDFIEGVKSLNMDDTCKPAYNDFKVSSANGINAADIAGVITCDGQQVDLAYRFEGTDDLKMTNIKLRPKA